MGRITTLAIGAMAAALLAPLPALAAGTGGCESFDFPVATDLQWMQSADAEAVASEAKLTAPPAKAMQVTLKPVAEVAYALPPESKAKPGEASFGAVVTFAGVPTPGLYQVSLSAKGWIDVIQNGAALKAVAHSGKSDCEGLRKSVRFDLKDGPVTLQISGVSAPEVKVTIRKTD
jgi:hypothetical protein